MDFERHLKAERRAVELRREAALRHAQAVQYRRQQFERLAGMRRIGTSPFPAAGPRVAASAPAPRTPVRPATNPTPRRR